MSQFEIEIKSLLGGEESAELLRERLKEHDPDIKLTSKNSQLNHYFEKGDLEKLSENMREHLSDEDQKKLDKIAKEGEKHSVRTRKLDEDVILVVKASIDDTTSSNGISRMEFEAIVDMTLGELDQIILDSDFEYQAKWSRKREEYRSGDMNVCIDKNAGYGYLAEFEKVLESADEADAAKRDLRDTMEKLGVEELPQDRLERMFAHYNQNWREYYGTEKIFIIE